MKRNLILATAVAALTSTMALGDAHSVVRMGTEGAYAPWNFLNDDGEVDGFERELGDELCARAELTCEWVTNDWDSIIPNLVSGNYDVIIAGMSITDERDEIIDFTQEYTPADPTAFVGLSMDVDIEGGVIAAQTGTIQAAYIADQGWTLVEFATPEETISAVRNGEADAVFADKSFLVAAIEGQPEMMLLDKEITLGGGVGMGIRESDTELKDTFNAAITSMKEDGSLNALITKWEVASTF